MNAYEKLRKQVSEELVPHTREIGKGIADISHNFKMLGLETAVWLPEKIHSTNLGGINADAYIGYSRVEGRWGLTIRIIERDDESGAYMSQRILTIESCSNLELLASALKKTGELANLINEAIKQQARAAEHLEEKIKQLQNLTGNF
jgi:hypothetical protein